MCPKILKIMPVDAYNASIIILKINIYTHLLCSNYANMHNLLTPIDYFARLIALLLILSEKILMPDYHQ